VISTIKTWLLGGLAVIASVLFALFRGEQAARAREKVKASEKARKTEQKASKALVDGLKKEGEAHENIDTINRTDFE